jgi:hypothetical protein
LGKASPCAGGAGRIAGMNKLLTMGGALVGGYAFWALGDALGFSFLGSFVLSGVGSLVGVYAGWKLARRLE